jgi:hypothetical protein
MYGIKILTHMPKLFQSTISTDKTMGIVFLTKYFTPKNKITKQKTITKQTSM